MIDVEKLPAVFWCTRDRIGGELVDKIEVWSLRPQRLACEDGDVIWTPPDEVLLGISVRVEDDPHCVGEWSIAEAYLRIGPGIPATDRECTRVGLDLPRVSASVS